MGKVIDLSGQKFGRWNVIKLLPYRAKHRTTVYDCVCDCQLSKPEAEREHHTILRTSLTSGRSTSCGCYFREIVHKQTGAHKKFNKYDLDSYEYGIGYASNNNDLFMFDKEDYNLLKQHTSSVLLNMAGKANITNAAKPLTNTVLNSSLAPKHTGSKTGTKKISRTAISYYLPKMKMAAKVSTTFCLRPMRMATTTAPVWMKNFCFLYRRMMSL